MTATITVFLIDDHPLMRRGLAALLGQQADLKVVGEAGDAAAALHLLPDLKADVVLLDNHLPGVRGVDAIADLRVASPVSHIVMLTVSDDEADLVAALRAGARGYLLKTMDGGPLADAVRRAARGESVVSPEMMGKLVAAVQAPDADGADMPATASPEPEPASPLSAREEDVLREIAAGASNKEIARTLAIAETTVKIHVQHILRKLGLSSRVQAAVYATERTQGR